MKVLLAPDKFKGSLTAAEVVQHLGNGLTERGIQYTGLPLADGGDGSVQAAIESGFRRIRITVAGATGHERPTVAAFDGTTAVIEVANTCGLHTLPSGKLAPLDATSKGVGQAVVSLLRRNPSRVVLALGGSASTDGGAGMLAALGARFLDDTGTPIAINGGNLHRVRSIDTTNLADLTGVEIIIASDVQNPLTGPDGAAAVYGPQKGATPELVTLLDEGLLHLVRLLTLAGHPEAERFAASPGAGAAGGLGFAGMLLGGRIVSGADYFLDLLNFDTHLQGCDLVITGEGRMDDQTLNGKLPAIIARRSGRVPVIAVVGRSDISPTVLAQMGIQAVHAIADHTDGNPASDSALSARLLQELGRTIPLPRSATTSRATDQSTISV
jgi:glycerate kinase